MCLPTETLLIVIGDTPLKESSRNTLAPEGVEVSLISPRARESEVRLTKISIVLSEETVTSCC